MALEKLGFKLESAKGRIDTLVVDPAHALEHRHAAIGRHFQLDIEFSFQPGFIDHGPAY